LHFAIIKMTIKIITAIMVMFLRFILLKFKG